MAPPIPRYRPGYGCEHRPHFARVPGVCAIHNCGRLRRVLRLHGNQRLSDRLRHRSAKMRDDSNSAPLHFGDTVTFMAAMKVTGLEAAMQRSTVCYEASFFDIAESRQHLFILLVDSRSFRHAKRLDDVSMRAAHQKAELAKLRNMRALGKGELISSIMPPILRETQPYCPGHIQAGGIAGRARNAGRPSAADHSISCGRPRHCRSRPA